MRRTKLLLLVYAAATATDLMAVLQENQSLRLISKSLLMPLLAVYAFARFRQHKAIFSILLVALGLSWCGDILLLIDEGKASYFVFGLISFLLAHVGFIALNHKCRYPDTASGLLPTQQMRYLFILTLAGSGIIYILYTHLGDLKLPVILYASVLTYMAISSLYRYGRTSGRSFALAFSGALFFMLSDSMLAINKFVENFSYAGFWVMFTYASAQFLIVEGMAAHVNGKG